MAQEKKGHIGFDDLNSFLTALGETEDLVEISEEVDPKFAVIRGSRSPAMWSAIGDALPYHLEFLKTNSPLPIWSGKMGESLRS